MCRESLRLETKPASERHAGGGSPQAGSLEGYGQGRGGSARRALSSELRAFLLTLLPCSADPVLLLYLVQNMPPLKRSGSPSYGEAGNGVIIHSASGELVYKFLL